MSPHIPHLTLQWHFDSKAIDFVIKSGAFPDDKGSGIVIGERNMSSLLAQHNASEEGRIALVVGSPVIDGCVDREAAARLFATTNDLDEQAKKLNGEFIVFILDQNTQHLSVFTDRFSSYPFYWAKNNDQFVGSYLYLDVARHCKKWPGFALRAEKAYEFFALQRLMGTDTHDTLTQYLPAASCLRVSADQSSPDITPYWQASYKKTQGGDRRTFGRKFVELFSRSVQARLSDKDQKSYGVFLSGGHDSRLVAAYADKPVTCYTLGFSENKEVECARNIANAISQDNIFQKIDDDYFLKTLEQSSYISGGMYALDHALFFPDDNQKTSDVYLHGHGLDYMYQGMYLHNKAHYLMGRETFVKKIVPLPGDITAHFIARVSFRLKYDYKRMLKSTYDKHLHRTVEAIFTQGRKKGLNSHQLWEYLIFHQPSRHYTFTNILSKRACGEVRTPTFDNDLYDFYWALPDKYRLHSDMLRYAMKAHPSGIANIPAGNHGAPAGWGPWQKTCALITRKVLKEMTRLKRFAMPEGADRTWPDRADYIKAHPAYWAAMLEPLKDERFKDFLDFMDWDKLEAAPENVLEQVHGAGLMVSLLSYYQFYKHLDL